MKKTNLEEIPEDVIITLTTKGLINAIILEHGIEHDEARRLTESLWKEVEKEIKSTQLALIDGLVMEEVDCNCVSGKDEFCCHDIINSKVRKNNTRLFELRREIGGQE